MIVGMTLVAVSLAFRSGVLGWLAFGLSTLTVTTILAAFPVRGRGLAQRIVDVLIACAGGWLIVASRSFSGVPLKWICFGSAGLLALFALIGLVVHEVSMELWVRPVVRESTNGRAQASLREQAPVH